MALLQIGFGIQVEFVVVGVDKTGLACWKYELSSKLRPRKETENVLRRLDDCSAA